MINASRPGTDAPNVSTESVREFFEGASADGDPGADVHLFFEDDELLAYERTRRETWASGARVYHISPYLRPDRHEEGILAEILDHVLRYQAEYASQDARSANAFLSAVPDPSNDLMVKGLLAAGFDPRHVFLSMKRSLPEVVAETPLPPDLELRPLREASFRAIYDFDRRIMSGRWGIEAPSEQHFRWWSEEAFLNPELWSVAWSGDTIVGTAAGVVSGTWNPRLGGERGEIRFVRVTPEYRRRGIATALILRCLNALWQCGVREVELGVDGENEDSAAALYRQLGFEVETQLTAYCRDALPPPPSS